MFVKFGSGGWIGPDCRVGCYCFKRVAAPTSRRPTVPSPSLSSGLVHSQLIDRHLSCKKTTAGFPPVVTLDDTTDKTHHEIKNANRRTWFPFPNPWRRGQKVKFGNYSSSRLSRRFVTTLWKVDNNIHGKFRQLGARQRNFCCCIVIISSSPSPVKLMSAVM